MSKTSKNCPTNGRRANTRDLIALTSRELNDGPPGERNPGTERQRSLFRHLTGNYSGEYVSPGSAREYNYILPALVRQFPWLEPYVLKNREKLPYDRDAVADELAKQHGHRHYVTPPEGDRMEVVHKREVRALKDSFREYGVTMADPD